MLSISLPARPPIAEVTKDHLIVPAHGLTVDVINRRLAILSHLLWLTLDELPGLSTYIVVRPRDLNPRQIVHHRSCRRLPQSHQLFPRVVLRYALDDRR